MKVAELLLKIWENQEESKKDITDIKVTLAEQKIILDEHQRRSIANEESVVLLKEQIAPLEKHVLIYSLVGKFILGVGVIVGIATGLIQIIDFLVK